MNALTAFYDRFIVPEWYKMWSVWLAFFAVIAPELLQIISQNLDLFFIVMPQVTDTGKAEIRLVLLCLIPVVRAIKQKPGGDVP